MKQILAVIALNQLETRMNNLQMCTIRSRRSFGEVLLPTQIFVISWFCDICVYFPSSRRNLCFNVEVLVVFIKRGLGHCETLRQVALRLLRAMCKEKIM